jgi:exopolysaccharide biosynthesis WecB/TagA/CpsF family protein
VNDCEVANDIWKTINSSKLSKTYTWVNHYSVLINISHDVKIYDFDFVGVDGQLLAYMIGSGIKTTAADRVLPLVLQKQIKILCIGGTEKNTLLRESALSVKFPAAKLVDNFNGFSHDLLNTRSIKNIFSNGVELIIIGTGSPHQENLALRIKEFAKRNSVGRGVAIVTCGGWLDQILDDAYYPAWSYNLKLNWLVRLTREPRRLWKRYSIYAIKALFKIRSIKDYLFVIVSKS